MSLAVYLQKQCTSIKKTVLRLQTLQLAHFLHIWKQDPRKNLCPETNNLEWVRWGIIGYLFPHVSRQDSSLIFKGYKVLLTLEEHSGLNFKGHKILKTLEEHSGLIFKGHYVLINLECKANLLSQNVRNQTPSNTASHPIRTDWYAAKILKVALLSYFVVFLTPVHIFYNHHHHQLYKPWNLSFHCEFPPHFSLWILTPPHSYPNCVSINFIQLSLFWCSHFPFTTNFSIWQSLGNLFLCCQFWFLMQCT
jgi:hypothetical protein